MSEKHSPDWCSIIGRPNVRFSHARFFVVTSAHSPAAKQATKIFLENRRFLKGLAAYYAPLPDIADDIIQDVFLEFVTKAERWNMDDPVKVKNLLGILTRQAAKRNWQKRRAVLSDILAKIADHVRQCAETNDQPPDFEREALVLKQCIAKLSEKGRTMIRLYYFEDNSVEEVAGKMRMKADTVSRNLSRLRVRLRQIIKKHIQENEIDDVRFG